MYVSSTDASFPRIPSKRCIMPLASKAKSAPTTPALHAVEARPWIASRLSASGWKRLLTLWSMIASNRLGSDPSGLTDVIA